MIDIHNFSTKLDAIKNLIKNSTKITERNKLLLLKFSADCQRNEYSYPDGYPQKEEFCRLLPVLKYPSEVNKIKVSKPQNRYHAQTRDELAGVPRAIMCKQRGWKPDSKQPERYARIVTKDVDSYYAKKFGLNGSEIKEQPKPGRYPRCKEVNAPGAGYCYKCGMPLSRKAENLEQQVQNMLETLLVDPEIHKALREKLLANGGLE